MRLGDLYLRHPFIALSVHTLTACALGYVSHTLQQQWHRENYLLLHISIWWVTILLVLMCVAERPRHRMTSAGPAKDEWSRHFRLNALIEGIARWFREPDVENQSEDMPIGGPLFRSICLRMPGRWRLNGIETSILHGSHSATFGGDNSPCFSLHFGEWDTGWRVGVDILKGASRSEVQDFLLDLHRTLETTDGITSVRWYHDEMLQGGQMSEADYLLGIATPIE